MRRPFRCRLGIVSLAFAAFTSHAAWAVNGTWNSAQSGDWDTAGNWVGGTIADGAGATANFTQPDLSAGSIQVNLVNPRTIGNLVFADSNPATGADMNWELLGSPLTLEGGTPTITVNAMNPGGVALINAPLAGTAGFAKSGAGVLALGNVAHTITGPVTVNAGTLRLDVALPPTTPITLGNGTTLQTNLNMDATGSRQFNVASGSTVNLDITGDVELGRMTADGATLNVTIEPAAGTFTPGGNWGATGSPAAFNVNSPNGGFLRLAPNLSSANGGIRNFNANTLLNSAVKLQNTTLWTRTNSGGNTVALGSLTGDATSILTGGGQGGGTVARYSIGNLNANTTFAGNIDTTTAPTPNSTTNVGGLDLTKVGTGTLTLSGTLSYQPTMNADASRRGGITNVAAGTLKLTGPAAIPGGVTDGTTNFLSTVRVQAAGTLDVSTAATPYSTAALQQVIGAGTIAGNYAHDEGTLAPGDTNTGTTATLVATAGTLTFANNLNLAGTGEIKFNISPSTTAGNDLIRVNGTTSLTGTPTLAFGFLGGLTTGNYTIIQSDGGFGGTTPAGWNVVWPGRGAAPSLAVSGNLLQLVVTAGSVSGNVRWTGNAGSDWVVGAAGPLNWHSVTTNAADRYFDQDAVTFADTFGTANTPVTNGTVTLNGTVAPLSVTVNNSALAYAITGTGKITGATGFTKQGTGTLTLQTANDFTGPAAINGGSVDIGNFNTALGAGALTMAGGKLIAANSATAALTNTAMTLSGDNTIQVDGSAGNPLTIPGWSGTGTMTLTTTVTGKLIDIGANNGFTGALNVGADGVLATGMTVRFNGGGSSLASSPVVLTNGASLRDRATSAQTISLGSLTGDATTFLGGYQGGSGATAKTWQIGALNTSTTFDGTIIDGAGSNSTVAVTNITKVGTGTLTLTGANTYTGFTRVVGGTLSITQPYLADAGDVFLQTGGTLNLNTSAATDLIDSLFINGLSQRAGTYGAVGSGAQFTTSLITGTGLLQVQTFVLQGDFNADNVVNAADLAVWRTGFGVDATGDADLDGDTDGADFLVWQRNIGQTNPAVAATNAVPEPGAVLLLAAACLALVAARRRAGV